MPGRRSSNSCSSDFLVAIGGLWVHVADSSRDSEQGADTGLMISRSAFASLHATRVGLLAAIFSLVSLHLVVHAYTWVDAGETRSAAMAVFSSEMEMFGGTGSGFPDCAPALTRPGCDAMPTSGSPFHTLLPTACTVCTPPPRMGNQIRVACVGDSITAGVEATSKATTYPAQLQQMLGERFIVTNLGSSGATMHADGARPYQQTAMYDTLLSHEWDIVIIMLGTNDGRTRAIADICDADMTKAFLWVPCSSPGWTWRPESSPDLYLQDARALVRRVLELGTPVAPTVLLMTPPPMVGPAISSIDRDVVNYVEPRLLSLASDAELGGAPLIDLHTPFGGTELNCLASGAESRPCTLWHGCHATNPYEPNEPPAAGKPWCDWLHPSDEGYQVIARTVYTAILSAMRLDGDAAGALKAL